MLKTRWIFDYSHHISVFAQAATSWESQAQLSVPEEKTKLETHAERFLNRRVQIVATKRSALTGAYSGDFVLRGSIPRSLQCSHPVLVEFCVWRHWVECSLPPPHLQIASRSSHECLPFPSEGTRSQKRYSRWDFCMYFPIGFFLKRASQRGKDRVRGRPQSNLGKKWLMSLFLWTTTKICKHSCHFAIGKTTNSK